MAQPYIGEIRLFAGNFSPWGWYFCDGRLLLIAEDETLFLVIGTTYGGDGQTTFAVPDLRGRLPIHQGTGAGLSPRVVGEVTGTERVALTEGELAPHGHQAYGVTTTAVTRDPTGAFPAVAATARYRSPQGSPPATTTDPYAIEPAGSNVPHENRMPYLAVNYIISRDGIFPSQT